MARINMPEKVERRRKGALARFKMVESRKKKQGREAREQELANLRAKLRMS
jgi:hypothetical protein